MNINSFDLNLLVIFRALFEEKNVTKASIKVGITQPAMSNALNRLRYLVKDELFIRGPKGMRPTQRAVELSGPVKLALSNIELSLFSANFDPFTSKKLFKFTISDDVAPLILPNLINFLSKNSPNSSLSISSEQGEEAIKLIDAGEIDFSVGRFETVPSRLGFKILFNEEYVGMMNKKHELSEEKQLSMEQYLSSKHLRVAPMNAQTSPIDRELSLLSLEREILIRIDLITLAPFILNNSNLILTLPNKTAERLAKANNFAIVKLPIALEKRKTKMIWHKELTNHPVYDWIRDKIN